MALMTTATQTITRFSLVYNRFRFISNGIDVTMATTTRISSVYNRFRFISNGIDDDGNSNDYRV